MSSMGHWCWAWIKYERQYERLWIHHELCICDSALCCTFCHIIFFFSNLFASFCRKPPSPMFPSCLLFIGHTSNSTHLYPSCCNILSSHQSSTTLDSLSVLYCCVPDPNICFHIHVHSLTPLPLLHLHSSILPLHNSLLSALLLFLPYPPFLSFIIFFCFLSAPSRSCPRRTAEEQGTRGRGGVDECSEWGDACGEDFGGGGGCGAEDRASRRWQFRWQLCE